MVNIVGHWFSFAVTGEKWRMVHGIDEENIKLVLCYCANSLCKFVCHCAINPVLDDVLCYFGFIKLNKKCSAFQQLRLYMFAFAIVACIRKQPNVDVQQDYLSRRIKFGYYLDFLSFCFLEEKPLDSICASH